ncbi:hypothetical protein TKK_0015461 [Trichogramma kaykai]
MKSNEKVSDFCDQFDGTVKLYDESEPPAPLTEHDKASAFFRATQERCDELRKSNWIQKAMSNVGMTVHEMKCYLLQAEANKNREQPRARTTKTVMEDRCFTCDQGGHKSPDCPLKEQNKWFCYKCQSVQNHIAAKCSNHRYDDGNKNKNNDRDRDGRGRGGGKSKVGGRKDSRHRPYQKPSNNSKPKSNNKGECFETHFASSFDKNVERANHIEFIADSRATEHITNKGFVLRDFEKCGGEIKCANSDESANISIDGRGTLILKSVIDNKNIELSNVILATNVAENLISLRKFVESGYSIYLDDEKLLVSDKITGERYLTGIYEFPNWILSFDASNFERDRLSRNRYRVKARLVTLDNFADQSPMSRQNHRQRLGGRKSKMI